ncbi:hypothetical protein JCM1840_005830 [Sporobolomyces johnsonii]
MYTGCRIQSDSELDGTPTIVEHKGYTTDEDDLDEDAAMANAFGTNAEPPFKDAFNGASAPQVWRSLFLNAPPTPPDKESTLSAGDPSSASEGFLRALQDRQQQHLTAATSTPAVSTSALSSESRHPILSLPVEPAPYPLTNPISPPPSVNSAAVSSKPPLTLPYAADVASHLASLQHQLLQHPPQNILHHDLLCYGTLAQSLALPQQNQAKNTLLFRAELTNDLAREKSYPKTPGLPGGAVNLDAFLTVIDHSDVVAMEIYSVANLLSQILTSKKVMDWARWPRARMTLDVSAGNSPRLSDIIEFVEATYKTCKLERKGPWFALKIVATEGMGQCHGKEVCAAGSDGEVLFVFSTSGNQTASRYSKGITDGIVPHACSHESSQLSVLPVGSRSTQDYEDPIETIDHLLNHYAVVVPEFEQSTGLDTFVSGIDVSVAFKYRSTAWVSPLDTGPLLYLEDSSSAVNIMLLHLPICSNPDLDPTHPGVLWFFVPQEAADAATAQLNEQGNDPPTDIFHRQDHFLGMRDFERSARSASRSTFATKCRARLWWSRQVSRIKYAVVSPS